MGWGRDFTEFARDLEELAEQFGKQATGRISGSGQDPVTSEFISPEGFEPKRRIAAGIGDAMENGIVPEAKRNASRYVTTEAKESITYQQGSWNVHRFGATHDLVKYHEFGTGTKASDPSKATINAPDGGGYVIPIEGYDSLPFGPDSVAMMDHLEFNFVVHPGVRGRHFMRDALRGNTWLIEEQVAEQLDQIKIDI